MADTSRTASLVFPETTGSSILRAFERPLSASAPVRSGSIRAGRRRAQFGQERSVTVVIQMTAAGSAMDIYSATSGPGANVSYQIKNDNEASR